jgi:hypothetical protein
MGESSCRGWGGGGGEEILTIGGTVDLYFSLLLVRYSVRLDKCLIINQNPRPGYRRQSMIEVKKTKKSIYL